MLRRGKARIELDGMPVEIIEPSAKELDDIIEIVNLIDQHANPIEQIHYITMLVDVMKQTFKLDITQENVLQILETVIRISCYDIEGKGDSNSFDSFLNENSEGYLLNELDFVCKRYGKVPQDLYSELSYNQIHYLYAVAYNNYLEELDLQCSLAGATRKSKPSRIILKGLEFMEGTTGKKIQQEAKRNRILNNRKHGEGLQNG